MDSFINFRNINDFTTSVRTGKTMTEIARAVKNNRHENIIENVDISNPDKVIFERPRIRKMDLVLYYQQVFLRIFPFLEKRLISTIRCPDKGKFYKKHF